MKRLVMKVMAGIAVLLVLVGGGLAAVATTRWDRTFEAPYPAITASVDEAVLARGRYLVYGPLHCAYCHASEEHASALEAGEEVPLDGGFTLAIPPGRFHMPNLTPDPETGIGGRTDGELARLLRHGVRADGRVAVPFMEYHGLSDADLEAVVSFLRSQAPVRNEVPDHEFTFLGKAVLATVMKPWELESAPPVESPPMEPTVKRGAYLVGVSQCAGCHTERNMRDGSFIGPRLAGGHTFTSESDPAQTFVSPNLTPAPETGVLADWSEELFVARFRAGPKYDGTPMPWGAFRRMTDADLRAIYRYLRTLEPIEHETGPVLRPTD